MSYRSSLLTFFVRGEGNAHRSRAVDDNGVFAIGEILLELDEETVFRIGVRRRDVEYRGEAGRGEKDGWNGLNVVVFAERKTRELLDGKTLFQLIGMRE